MADTGDGMSNMISKALTDPRFAEIFGVLKSKADNGELDVSALSGMLNVNGAKEEKEGKETEKQAVGAYANEAAFDNQKDAGNAKMNDIVGMLSPLLNTSSKTKHRETEKHEALLCALKPYLADSKKNAVDSILKVAKIGDILEIFGSDKKESQT